MAGVQLESRLDECREHRKKAIAELASGEPLGGVAKKFGLGETYLRRCAKLDGVKVPRKSVAAKNYKILEQLLTTMKSRVQIADELEVSRERVRQVFDEAVEQGVEF